MNKRQSKIDAAIAQADEVRHLTIDEVRAMRGIGRIAAAMIEAHGFYGFTNFTTGRKVCILPR